MENEYVNKINIWRPCKQGEGQIVKEDGSEMKLVASIINGHVIHLERDYCLEMQKISKKEAEYNTLFFK